MIMPVRLLHRSNAHFPICVVPADSVTLARLLQPEKQASPNLVTPPGITMPVRLLHSKKA